MNNDELKVGAFYWVLPAHDVDSADAWVNEKQPARYAGDNKWQLLDTEGTDWPVIWVGTRIEQPTE